MTFNGIFPRFQQCPYTNGQQVLYASFFVIFTNLPITNGAGSDFAHFVYSSSSFEGKLWRTQGNPGAAFGQFHVCQTHSGWVFAAMGTSSTFVNKVYPVDLALNTPYQVVEELDPR